MGGAVPKAWLPLAGVAIALRAARRLQQLPGHLGTVLVVHPDDRQDRVAALRQEFAQAGVTHVVDGGETRQDSVLAGARAARADAELLLVHDAARPLFPLAATGTALRRAADAGGAILALPARDTIKEADAHGRILRTVPRETLWQAQTPQVFRRQLLLRDLERAQAAGFAGTDEASVVEHFGGTVVLVEGSSLNLKITTPEDLLVATGIVQQQEEHRA